MYSCSSADTHKTTVGHLLLAIYRWSSTGGHLPVVILCVCMFFSTGAVVFGLDPAIISVRRSKLTYGAAVLNRFVRGRHPDSKLVVKDGVEWCRDVFDIFVSAGQVVRAGETVVRQYIPAAPTQSRIVIGIYCTEQSNPGFVSDPGVRKCANVSLDLGAVAGTGSAPLGSVPQTTTRRRIEARLVFAETEVKVTATDTTTGRQVDASIDFLNV